MAIKSRVIVVNDENITEYLYAKCEVESEIVMSLEWLLDSNLDKSVVGFRGAPNERQLLEVDDSIDDDIKSQWLQVDATDTGMDDLDGNDIMEYSVSRVDASRDSEYMAELRAERDSLLTECDCIVIRHRDQIENSETTSLSGAEYTDVLNYRKELRDWPSTETNIYARTAPTKPGVLL